MARTILSKINTRLPPGDGPEERGDQRDETGRRLEPKPGAYQSASDCGGEPETLLWVDQSRCTQAR
jgi:hypothetical protein